MPEIASNVVAVIGTLLGTTLAFVLQGRLAARQVEEARRDRRRDEFLTAAATLTSSIAALIQAEYDRAKRRLNGEVGAQREQARQDAYDRRTDARTAQYRLQLVGDPSRDTDLLAMAMHVIEISKEISVNTTTTAEVNSKNREAKQALARLVVIANQRVRMLDE